MEELQHLANSLHNIELPKKDGHVAQFWGDGEITLTKCGSLFGRRTLHTIEMPLSASDVFTLKERKGNHTFVYIDLDDAHTLRKKMQELLSKK
jgi:hypothetical protein